MRVYYIASLTGSEKARRCSGRSKNVHLDHSELDPSLVFTMALQSLRSWFVFYGSKGVEGEDVHGGGYSSSGYEGNAERANRSPDAGLAPTVTYSLTHLVYAYSNKRRDPAP